MKTRHGSTFDKIPISFANKYTTNSTIIQIWQELKLIKDVELHKFLDVFDGSYKNKSLCSKYIIDSIKFDLTKYSKLKYNSYVIDRVEEIKIFDNIEVSSQLFHPKLSIAKMDNNYLILLHLSTGELTIYSKYDEFLNDKIEKIFEKYR